MYFLEIFNSGAGGAKRSLKTNLGFRFLDLIRQINE